MDSISEKKIFGLKSKDERKLFIQKVGMMFWVRRTVCVKVMGQPDPRVFRAWEEGQLGECSW